MTTPDFRFLRRMVYTLTRQYPCSIGLYHTSPVTQDYKTGIKSSTQVNVQVRKAAVLPDNVLKKVTHVVGAQFQYGGSVDARTRRFLVSRRDIPSTFAIDMNVQIVYDHKRYTVTKIDEYEHEAVVFTGELVDGAPTNEIFDIRVHDDVGLSDQVATS